MEIDLWNRATAETNATLGEEPHRTCDVDIGT